MVGATVFSGVFVGCATVGGAGGVAVWHPTTTNAVSNIASCDCMMF